MYCPRTDLAAGKARKAVTPWALTYEMEVHRMAAGRVIVRDEEGRLSGGLTTKLSGRRKRSDAAFRQTTVMS